MTATHRAVDDPAALAWTAQIIRTGLERRRLRLAREAAAEQHHGAHRQGGDDTLGVRRD